MNRLRFAALPLAAAVIAAAGIYLGVSRHRTSQRQRGREDMMRSDLALLRGAVRRYRSAHGAPPRSLREAVATVPADPVTGRTDTWRLTFEQNVTADDFAATARPLQEPGIIDVHSGAPGTDTHGVRWSDY